MLIVVLKAFKSLVSNINIVSKDKQWSALTIAAYFNCCEIIDWLLKYPGIDVNIKTMTFDCAWTPLMFACRARNFKVVKRLCEESNIDMNYKGKSGFSVAHCAAR